MNKSILIVDDNKSMTQTLAAILRSKSLEVHAAFCGNEAIHVLENHSPNYLLTDVKMPDMNGLTLFQNARRLHPDLITFFMTAYASDTLLQTGLAEGVRKVFIKPFDLEDLFLSL